MCDRDDANLRHFRSRAQEPKVLMGKPPNSRPAPGPYAPPGLNVNVFVLDAGFGSSSDQIDATRFRYVGTSPSVSTYQGHREKMSSQRTLGQSCMREGFHS